jgi:hypothetical protein
LGPERRLDPEIELVDDARRHGRRRRSGSGLALSPRGLEAGRRDPFERGV